MFPNMSNLYFLYMSICMYVSMLTCTESLKRVFDSFLYPSVAYFYASVRLSMHTSYFKIFFP